MLAPPPPQPPTVSPEPSMGCKTLSGCRTNNTLVHKFITQEKELLKSSCLYLCTRLHRICLFLFIFFLTSLHPLTDSLTHSWNHLPICCLCLHSTMELALETSVSQLPNINFHLKTKCFSRETGLRRHRAPWAPPLITPGWQIFHQVIVFLLWRKAYFHRRISPLCAHSWFTVSVFTFAFYLCIILSVSRI